MSTPHSSKPDAIDIRAWGEQLMAQYGIQAADAVGLGLKLVMPDEAAHLLGTELLVSSAGLWISYPKLCEYGRLLLQKPMPQVMRDGCVRLVEYIAPQQLPSHAYVPRDFQLDQVPPDDPIILVEGELTALSFLRGALKNVIGLQGSAGWQDEQSQAVVPELRDLMTPGRRFVWLYPAHATWRADCLQHIARFDQECRARECVLQLNLLPTPKVHHDPKP